MRLTTHGLIVKEQTVGEKDKLVTAVTADMGLIRAFVKGAKNIASRKQSPITTATSPVRPPDSTPAALSR